MESYRILEIFCEHLVLHPLILNFGKCLVLMDAVASLQLLQRFVRIRVMTAYRSWNQRNFAE